MKIIKRIFFLLVCGILCMSEINVCAKEQSNSITKKEIEQLFEDYGYEIAEVNVNDTIKSFNSINEVQEYLEKIDELTNENNVYHTEIKISQDKPLEVATLSAVSTASTVYTANHLINWYNPFAGFDGLTLLCWSNVYIGYSYTKVDNKPSFVAVHSVDSYLSGISTTWWDQKGYNVSYSTVNSNRDKASIKVDGCYVLGIEINGMTIGARRNATWNCSLTLI